MARGSRVFGGSAAREEEDTSHEVTHGGRGVESAGAGPGGAAEGGPLGTQEGTSGGNGMDASLGQSTESATSSDQQESDGKKPKKSEEQKSADWVRLGNSRTTDALKAMILLGHLGNTSQYIWTEAQERKLIGALRDQVDALEELFTTARIAYESGEKRKGSKQLLLNLAAV